MEWRKIALLALVGGAAVIGLEVLLRRTTSRHDQLARAWRQTAEAALLVVRSEHRLPRDWSELTVVPAAADLPWDGVRRHVSVEFGWTLDQLQRDPDLRHAWITMPKDRVDLRQELAWFDQALSGPAQP